MSLAWTAYRVVAPCLGALAPAASVFASPHERPLWRERMGEVGRPGGTHAWIHAASLGEANAVPPLVRELERTRPGARLWLTASTRTGRGRLAEGGGDVSLAPIDSPQATRRFFAGVQPERLLLIETELWPHWLMRAHAERVPVAVVSARLSERSVRRYRGLGPGMRALVGGLSGVLCQSQDDLRRWLAIGAPREKTVVVGNLKNDGLPVPVADRRAERAAHGLDPSRPLLVLGSLRPGEARVLGRAWVALPEALRERWQVVAVPRHPRASDELAAEATGAGVTLSREEARPGQWRWDDRTGVLVGWYRACDVAFVGGSLTPFAGHNPLEPAACGAAVFMGPHHASQRDAVRALEGAGGISIANDARDAAAVLARLLGDDAARESQAVAASAVAKSLRGSAARAVRALEEFGLWPV